MPQERQSTRRIGWVLRPGRTVRIRHGKTSPEAMAETLAGEVLEPEGLRAGPDGRHIHCAGLRLWVVEEGDPSGPVVLLLHGLGVHGGIWAPAVPMLVAQGFRVIVPDLPGHGRSDSRRRASYSPRFHTRALLALLDALNVSRVTAIGNSLGGLLAARLALAAPGRVDRLVLVDATGLTPEGVPLRSRLAYLPAALPTLLGTSPSPVWMRLFLSRMVVSDPALVPSLAALTEAYLPSVTALRRTAMGLVGPEGSVASDLPKIDIPTLLVWGTEDPQIPIRQAEEALRALPQATLVRIAGSGHVPMWEKPEAFCEALYDFLCRPGRGAPHLVTAGPPELPTAAPVGTIPTGPGTAPDETSAFLPGLRSDGEEAHPPAPLLPDREPGWSLRLAKPAPGPQEATTGAAAHRHRLQGRVPLRRLSDRQGSLPGPERLNAHPTDDADLSGRVVPPTPPFGPPPKRLR